MNLFVVKSISSFLSFCISNNAMNQDKFADCNGILVLKRCIEKFHTIIMFDMKDCDNDIKERFCESLGCIIVITSTVVLDNDKNAECVEKLGILSLISSLLFVDNFNSQIKTKILLTLGHCSSFYDLNKLYLAENVEIEAVLKKFLLSDDQELSSASKYFLEVLLEKGCLKEKKTLKCIESDEDYHLEQERRTHTRSISHLSSRSFENSGTLSRNHSQVSVKLRDIARKETAIFKLPSQTKAKQKHSSKIQTDIKPRSHNENGSFKSPGSFTTSCLSRVSNRKSPTSPRCELSYVTNSTIKTKSTVFSVFSPPSSSERDTNLEQGLKSRRRHVDERHNYGQSTRSCSLASVNANRKRNGSQTFISEQSQSASTMKDTAECDDGHGSTSSSRHTLNRNLRSSHNCNPLSENMKPNFHLNTSRGSNRFLPFPFKDQGTFTDFTITDKSETSSPEPFERDGFKMNFSSLGNTSKHSTICGQSRSILNGQRSSHIHKNADEIFSFNDNSMCGYDDAELSYRDSRADYKLSKCMQTHGGKGQLVESPLKNRCSCGKNYFDCPQNSSVKNGFNSDQMPESDKLVKVIVYPGFPCNEHNLCSSFETLRVVILDDKADFDTIKLNPCCL